MICTLLLISYIAIKNVQPYSTRSIIPVIDCIQQIPEKIPAVEYPSSVLEATRPFFFQSQNILSPFPYDVQASYKSLADLKDSCSKKLSTCLSLQNKENSKPLSVSEIKSNSSTSEKVSENLNTIPETTLNLDVQSETFPAVQNVLSAENVEPNTMQLVDSPIANVLPIDIEEQAANVVPLENQTSDAYVIPLETENTATNPGQIDAINTIPNIVQLENENLTSNIAPIDIAPIDITPIGVAAVSNDPAETGEESDTNIVSVQNDDIVSEENTMPVANELSDSGTPPINALSMLEESSTVVVDQIESVSKEIITSVADNEMKPDLLTKTPIEPASALHPDKTPPTV